MNQAREKTNVVQRRTRPACLYSPIVYPQKLSSFLSLSPKVKISFPHRDEIHCVQLPEPFQELSYGVLPSELSIAQVPTENSLVVSNSDLRTIHIFDFAAFHWPQKKCKSKSIHVKSTASICTAKEPRPYRPWNTPFPSPNSTLLESMFALCSFPV